MNTRIVLHQALDHRARGRLRHRCRTQRLGRALLRLHHTVSKQRSRRIWASSMPSPRPVAPARCTWALAALGIGPGDEVILADTNWIATAAPRRAPRRQAGLRRCSSRQLVHSILPRSKRRSRRAPKPSSRPTSMAICATWIALLAIGREHGIPVIEDAAEAIGSVWRGDAPVSMGAFGTFSFHGTKTLTTGEGGMFVTNDPGLYETVLTLQQSWPRGGAEKAILAGHGWLQVQDVECAARRSAAPRWNASMN